MFNEELLSNSYKVRRLTEKDVDIVYELCCKNTLFYKYHPPIVSKESILEDMVVLPTNKSLKDKYYIGFFKDETIIAVMDLIIGYPKDGVAFIGFFMLDVNIQGNGIGSDIINECISYLKRCSINRIRLGVDKANPQSFRFWRKNNFQIDKKAIGNYIVMERTI